MFAPDCVEAVVLFCPAVLPSHRVTSDAVWSGCFGFVFVFDPVLMNPVGLNDLVMTRTRHDFRTASRPTFLRARLLAGGFATRFSVAECKAMERSCLVLFEGILCSLPLVGCDSAGDALTLS